MPLGEVLNPLGCYRNSHGPSHLSSILLHLCTADRIHAALRLAHAVLTELRILLSVINAVLMCCPIAQVYGMEGDHRAERKS